MLAYGACTIVGNFIVGRHNTAILRIGHGVLLVALVMLATMGSASVAAPPGAPAIGLVGVALNPALVPPVVEVAGVGGMVSTADTSVFTLGVVAVSTLGGVAIAQVEGTGAAIAAFAALSLACADQNQNREPALQHVTAGGDT